ncbi:MAG TPA: endolytic transglycosylase MltG [Symbiobacteriaceae bacterium]|nr:endolytic transglycosylase MltG [Symbiobacteriaceae bacterium]
MPALARLSRWVVLIMLALLAIAGGAARQWLTSMLQPVNAGAVQPIVIEIPAGASTRAVADLLAGQHLVKDAVFFRYYARYLQLDSRIHSGEYELSQAMTPMQILEKITRGEVVVRRFTVREGLTVEETAGLLASLYIIDKERFLQLAAESKLADPYLPQEPEAREQPLEGYLFPSTYDYKRGVTEEEIIEMMFSAWEQNFTPELRQRAAELNMTVHEVMALASIIEKEAQVAAERPVISGVYHNRLNIGMKLDADPTVRYAAKKPVDEDLLLADLDVESPYNTYRNAGLPPGPIAAPGLASIKAALYPESHDYWYFVAKADGSGEHYFATTLAEQDENIGRARENGQE